MIVIGILYSTSCHLDVGLDRETQEDSSFKIVFISSFVPAGERDRRCIVHGVCLRKSPLVEDSVSPAFWYHQNQSFTEEHGINLRRCSCLSRCSLHAFTYAHCPRPAIIPVSRRADEFSYSSICRKPSHHRTHPLHHLPWHNAPPWVAPAHHHRHWQQQSASRTLFSILLLVTALHHPTRLA